MKFDKEDWEEINQHEYKRLKKSDPKNVNGYTCRIMFKYFKKKIIDFDIDYLDKFFPKGDNRRGKAMVLLALARKHGEQRK